MNLPNRAQEENNKKRERIDLHTVLIQGQNEKTIQNDKTSGRITTYDTFHIYLILVYPPRASDSENKKRPCRFLDVFEYPWLNENDFFAIKKNDKKNRFGRGIGLQFVKLVGEWRPGREGRQEIIKVKVFEDQNVEFRTKAKAKTKAIVAGRVRREDGTAAVLTQTGNVIVATITPDKLVRFWTSHGEALGSLNQASGQTTHPTVWYTGSHFFFRLSTICDRLRSSTE